MTIFKEKDCLSSIDGISFITVKQGIVQTTPYTFCVPTFKRSCELKECLDSIYAQQTDIPFNVIVSDNNPERGDETEQLLSDFFSEKKNLTYIKNSVNLGMAGNWNRLLLECTTEFMILFHDDDVLAPFFLQQINDIVSLNQDVAALNCGTLLWYGASHYKYHSSNIILKHDAKTNYCRFVFGPPTGCVFSVKEARSIGGFDPDTYPSLDYVFVEKLCLAHKKVLTTKSELMRYRMGTNASVKLPTQEGFLKLDWQIRQELSELLNINPLLKRIVLFFETKLALRAVYKLGGNKSFMEYTAASRPFLLLSMIYLKVLDFVIVLKYKLK